MIALYLEAESAEVFNGQVQLNESCFGGPRNGERGRGTIGKIAVIGILKDEILDLN